jgi:hypothetical protein
MRGGKFARTGTSFHDDCRNVCGFTAEGDPVEFGDETLDCAGSTCCRWLLAAKACCGVTVRSTATC